MNQIQPSVNWAAASQRMDERRSAASNYRLARTTEHEHRVRKLHVLGAGLGRRVTAFRDAVGQRLIALGERVSVHEPKTLGEH